MTSDGDNGNRKWECGLRPIGAYAYAPVGMRKIKAKIGRGKMGRWGLRPLEVRFRLRSSSYAGTRRPDKSLEG
jgi:hypothetical protein